MKEILWSIRLSTLDEIKFVIDQGSNFAQGLVNHLAEIGAEVMTWADAIKAHFDVVIAAHAHANLAAFEPPVVLMSHGASHCRLVPETTGDYTSSSGMSQNQLVHESRLIPSLIGLSSSEQQERLHESCPSAAELAVVLGDPVIDQLVASNVRRAYYRKLLGVDADQKLVVVSSTWGPLSLWARHPELVDRLLGQLPISEYKVALITHPNIWSGHSRYEIPHNLRDALDSGLVVVLPETSWQAVVIAGDVLIGDHGSVSRYGAALGLPFLLAADGTAELDPHSPAFEFCERAERLDFRRDLRAQMETAFLQDRSQVTAITDKMFEQRGDFLENLQRELLNLIDRPLSSAPRLRMSAIPDPTPLEGDRITSFLTSAVLNSSDDESGSINIEQFPSIVGHESDSNADLILILEHNEVDSRVRSRGEIFVHTEMQRVKDANIWMSNIFEEYPGLALAATTTRAGTTLRFRDGVTLKTSSRASLIAAAAAYRWRFDGKQITKAFRLRIDVGPTRKFIDIEPHSVKARLR